MEAARRLFCGVDVGASATKLVLADERKDVVARVIRPSGVDYKATARDCLAEATTEARVVAINQRIQVANTVDEVLKIAVSELGDLLEVENASVELKSKQLLDGLK